jgi:hypothetical protein
MAVRGEARDQPMQGSSVEVAFMLPNISDVSSGISERNDNAGA